MNENFLDIAKQQILEPAGLSELHLDKVLGELMGHRIDGGDLYFQLSHHESWMLEDGIVKEGGYSVDRGVGIRAISKDKTGFAYSDEIVLPALLTAARSARAIAKSGQQKSISTWNASYTPALYQAADPLTSISDADKIDLLEKLDRYARQVDRRVEQVFASLTGGYETVLVAAIDGTLAADIRPLVRVNVSVIAQHNGRREQGSFGGGGRFTYTYFLEQDRLKYYAEQAVRQALINLEAVDAPAGIMPVVLGPGWPGVLLHEAIGHGLEGDFNRKGTSAFSGRIGEQVASSLCTIVDDGAMPERRGSLTIDDEGTPTQQTMLIENGILKAYMQDKMNAKLMGVPPTGNGRRESYSHLPCRE